MIPLGPPGLACQPEQLWKEGRGDGGCGQRQRCPDLWPRDLSPEGATQPGAQAGRGREAELPSTVESGGQGWAFLPLVFFSGKSLGDPGGRPGRGRPRGPVGWGHGLGWAGGMAIEVTQLSEQHRAREPRRRCREVPWGVPQGPGLADPLGLGRAAVFPELQPSKPASLLPALKTSGLETADDRRQIRWFMRKGLLGKPLARGIA